MLKNQLIVFVFLSLLFAPVTAFAIDGLVGALTATMRSHPAIKGKRAEVSAQNFVIDSAKANRLPTLSTTVNTLYTNDQGTLSIQQPIWTFGKITNAIDQAEAGLDSERFALLQVKRQLIERVAVIYARILGLQRQEQVTEDNIQEHQRLVQHILRRYRGQLASQSDVSLGTARLVLAKTQQARISADLQNAMSDLASLTLAPVVVAEPIPPAMLQLPPLAEVERLALTNHADLQLKQAQREVAKLKIDGAKQSLLPDIYVRAEHELLDTATSERDSRIGLVIESSLGGMGMVANGQIREARARYQASQEDWHVTRIEVQRTISALMSDREKYRAQAQAQEETVAAIESALGSYLRLYNSGFKAWIDVLNLQRELAEQQLQWELMQSEYTQASLRLATLIGALDDAARVSDE